MAKVTASDGHEYHKSQSANATEAPTNQATKDAVTPKGLTPEGLDFVTIVHYEYGLQAQLPTVEYLKLNYNYTKTEIDLFYADASVKAALEERGIEFASKLLEPAGVDKTNPYLSKPKPTPKITPIQLLVANAMLDLTDTRSEKKKLNDLGVTTAKYQSWLRDPDFSGYLRDRVEKMIGEDAQHEAMLSLMDGVRSGNIKHIQYYHQLIGRFTPPTASGNAAPQGPDLNNIIVSIIEIIVDEVEDPATADRIAGRLKGLVMGHQFVQELNEPIVKPEIAEPRELTPAVQELTSRGLGYDS